MNLFDSSELEADVHKFNSPYALKGKVSTSLPELLTLTKAQHGELFRMILNIHSINPSDIQRDAANYPIPIETRLSEAILTPDTLRAVIYSLDDDGGDILSELREAKQLNSPLMLADNILPLLAAGYVYLFGGDRRNLFVLPDEVCALLDALDE